MWRSQVVEEDLLYLADAHTLLDYLKATPSSEQCAGMVGHNPGITDLLQLLRRSDTNTSRFEALTTLGETRLTLTGSWQDLAPNI
jgi:phosphohistidine phosphatase